MANGPNNTQQVDVELLAESGDIAKAMDVVNAKIEKAALAVQKIVTSADQGSKKFDNQLNRTVRDLQQAMSQLSTLEKSIYSGAGGVRQLRAAEKFGKDTEAAARFAGTIKNAGTAVEAVGARIRDLTKKMGVLGQQDFLPKQKMLRAQNDLRDVERQLKSVGSTMERLNTKGRIQGGDFSAQQKEVAAAQTALLKALQDGRRTNFAPEMQRLQDATAKYALDLRTVEAELRRTGQAYDQLIQKARAYTTETNFQREGRLRRESGRLAIPGDVSTEGAAERLAQATLRAANARERLNTALRSNAGQAELAKAVSEYELYNRELVEAIALHNKLQRELKQSAAEQAAQAARAARGQVEQNRKGPLQSILSPSYGVAAFARTSVYGAAAMGAYAIADAVRGSIQFVFEFEDALANLQAISAATSGEMEILQAKILDVASNSKFSTLELTQAATALAQAGMSTQEMEKALGAVSRLAAASGATISESTDLMTASIGAFQLQASEADRIADAMVAGLNRTRLTVQQSQLLIQYLGATAHDAGISLNEVLAAGAALSQAGVRSGSTQGTGLRTLLTDLADPSKKLADELKRLGLTADDVNVKVKGFRPVMETLRDAGFGAAQAYGSLELRAAAAFLTLSQNLDVMDDVRLAMLQQGQAAEAAEKSMSSLSAQWSRFRNLVGAELYSSGGQTGLTGLLKDLNDLIDQYDETKAAAQQWADDTEQRFNEAAEAGDHLTTVTEGFKLSWIKFHDELAGAGLLPVEPYMRSAAEAADDLDTAMAKTGQTISEYRTRIASVDDAIENLLVRQDSLMTNQAELGAETSMLASRFDGLSAKLMENARSFEGALKALRAYRAEAVSFLKNELLTQQNQLNAKYSSDREGFISAGRGVSGIRDPQFQKLRGAVIQANNKGTFEAQYLAQRALSNYVESTAFSGDRNAARNYVSAAGRLTNTRINYRQNRRDLEKADYYGSAEGRKIFESGQDVSAGLTRLQSTTQGMTSGERKKYFSATAAAAAETARSLRKAAETAPTEGARMAMLEQAATWDGFAGQANASMSSIGEKKPKAKTDRAGAREARRRLSSQKSISEAALKAARMDLDEALSDAEEPTDLSDFRDNLDEVNKALQAWKSKRLDAMKAEIAKGQMTPAEAENYTREIQKQIAQEEEKTFKALADTIVSMLENSLEAADRAAQKAMQPFEDGLKLMEGRLQSLDRIGVRDKIPDYVRENMQFRKDQLNEASQRNQILVNDKQIEDYQVALADLKAGIADLLKASGGGAANENLTDDIIVTGTLNGSMKEFSGKTLKEVRTALDDTTLKIHDLTVANEALRASFDGASQIPQTLGEAFQQASAAYARSVGLNRTMKESIINDLGGAISETHDAFTQFWNDMLSRPQDVLNNLKNFALAVGRILQQMAAQALANQIFGSILNLVGMGTTAGLGSAGKGLGSSIGSIIPRFNGGSIDRAEGGLVTEGVPNRDSVNTNLARGEFVTRKAAVDSVGLDFMRDVNKRGVRALKSLAPTPIIAPAPKQEMAVYLIAPEERPSLGPNDVVAVMTNEMLKDGSTKKLIKHIAQGG